jgi:transposase InsO family protein
VGAVLAAPNMNDDKKKPSTHERWAHLRFSVVGPLLASPPAHGELQTELETLAAKSWLHPTTNLPMRIGLSTLERWYYQAKKSQIDPVGVLRRKIRSDLGSQAAMPEALKQALRAQYAAHKSWSYQLHYDNLKALVATESKVGELPSYSTVRRYMKAVGLLRRRRLSSSQTDGTRRAEARLEEREVRSYENPYVNGLWHLDFHHGSKKVLSAKGEYVTPLALGILDDFSRLCCHLQWYLAPGEETEDLVHGLKQAIHKRGLPRSLMSDNGSAMTAAETTQGLARLAVVHVTTLAHSPYQNGKQENFWAQLEGRLMAMLENVPDLTLAALNEASQAWAELEYNRKLHSEIGSTPLKRFLEGKDVGRDSPSSESLRLAFCLDETRTQRRSDGTISLLGRRLEVPSQYRHLAQVRLRYARWDLSHVHLVDERTGAVLCRLYPLDKAANADGLRRTFEPVGEPSPPVGPPAPTVPPLLARLLAERASTRLPPAYLPQEEKP